MSDWTDVIHKYISGNALKVEEHSVEKKNWKKLQTEGFLKSREID